MSLIIHGIGQFHTPTYKVFGMDRRKLMRERNFLRSSLKSNTYYDQINEDLFSIYGFPKTTITEEDKQQKLEKAKALLVEINAKLLEPFEKNSTWLIEKIHEVIHNREDLQKVFEESPDISEEFKKAYFAFVELSK